MTSNDPSISHPSPSIYFQDHMPENICFGCGHAHPSGLRIRSRWAGEVAVCDWQPALQYQGWEGLLNGGIAAALLDCHCMCAAMADAYRRENRTLDSRPYYRYATGTLNLRYVRPTPIDQLLRLEARVIDVKGRKTTLEASLSVKNNPCVQAHVIAIQVYNSADPHAPHTAFGTKK